MKVNTMFRYILQKGNPFDMIPNPLHNVLTKTLVPQETKKQILDVFQTGDNLYSTLRKARHENKITRIFSTVHKVMLPAFHNKCWKMIQTHRTSSGKISLLKVTGRDGISVNTPFTF